MPNFLHVECPSCHSKYSVDRDELTKPRKVKCIDCGYQWIYAAPDDTSSTNSSENSDKLINEIDVEDDERGDFDYNLEENTYIKNDADNKENEIDQNDESNSHVEDDRESDDLDDLFSDLDDVKNNKTSKQDLISDKLDEKDDFDDIENSEELEGENQNIEENEEVDGDEKENDEENDDLDDLFSDLDDIKNTKSNKKEIKEEVEEEYEEVDEDNYEDEDDEEKDEENEENEENEEKDVEDDENEEADDEDEKNEDNLSEILGKSEESQDEISEENEENSEESENIIQKIIKYGAVGILIAILLGLLFSFGLNSYSVLPNSMKSVLSFFGVKNVDGLEIIDLKPKIIINRENSFNIIINGNIANLSNKEKNIPEIFIFVYDKNKNFRKYSFEVEKKSLQPMEYQKFNYKIFAIDFEPTKIEVRLINDMGKYVIYK